MSTITYLPGVASLGVEIEIKSASNKIILSDIKCNNSVYYLGDNGEMICGKWDLISSDDKSARYRMVKK